VQYEKSLFLLDDGRIAGAGGMRASHKYTITNGYRDKHAPVSTRPTNSGTIPCFTNISASLAVAGEG
jgi:hypothetical protein